MESESHLVLSNKYKKLDPWERLELLFKEFDPKKILVTSSFGSTSALLLHMISKVSPGHPIHFIDTSFHFEETLQYRYLLSEKLKLNVIDVRAEYRKNKFTRENTTYKYNQDLCCYINKVDPINKLKAGYDIWISGLIGYQNANRSKLNIFEPKEGLLKFHPIIDMTEEETSIYSQIYELPVHKLKMEGYGSIGCIHCTKKGDGRKGRWSESMKTECGLHV